MDLGSNSILDLTKLPSQKSLFTKSDWKSLKCKFSERLDDNNLILDLNDAKLQEIEKLAKIAPSEARTIASKYKANHRSVSSTLFDFYYEYLKVLKFKKYVFRKDIDITKTVMIVKTEETIGDSGSLSKSGFKVDLRVIRDVISKTNKRKEEDTANAEVARLDASIGKIDGDRCKLLLESKCVLDRLINVTHDDTIVVCALQLAGINIDIYEEYFNKEDSNAVTIVGLQATLFSLVLEADGLYVGIKEASASLPTSDSVLKNLREAYNVLSAFKIAACATADLSLRQNVPAATERGSR
ncbi:hypothetical protein G6F29_011426 [Rhizopus arrhizus]|uniref:Uncharacterized protein n=1 Tax=Rhizopus oryzae TaxID=64495 RepID=A0A9P6WZY7_RHIOR|nr:hypothetical protein G6F23_009160 [Rhizopus arrhizus]KAG0756129.1 hypothetical protein G6F24_011365 [Rhizopus arrhizus]KAG0782419.1 hypothetical protein G6F21_011121 [Rhizopus arrhizus]KAG0787439.1 hypothetical protein G6F22_007321 [Rhizopus arrhizus]KAG0806977.1 hypothetical protein G6F20_010703 [Rhizopus arrhizus]